MMMKMVKRRRKSPRTKTVKIQTAMMRITSNNLLMVISKLTSLRASVKRSLTSTTLVRKS